ncbi:esterase [Actinoplanes sp. N902-109]|nr:esterase [Actinoplanes sp. N902-109]
MRLLGSGALPGGLRLLGLAGSLGLLMPAGCAAPAAPPPSGMSSPSSSGVPSSGAAPAVTRVLRVMPLGDSITMGAGSVDGSGYRALLYRRLTAAGIRVDFVGSQHTGAGPDADHEGHSGWTLTQLARHLDAWLDTARPDVVLLHAGTNDLRTPAAAALAPQVLTRVLATIARDRPAAEVYVAEIIGNQDIGDGRTRQRRADAYNEQVPAIVAAAGAHFHLVDQSAVRGPADLSDKLHPNDAGYRQMAATWFHALQQL